MSNYADDYFDQQRDSAVQMQAEFEGRARRVCSWHAKHFPGQPNLIEDGGSGETSHGMCCNCAAIENDKVDAFKLARARAEADWAQYQENVADGICDGKYEDMESFMEAI